MLQHPSIQEQCCLETSKEHILTSYIYQKFAVWCLRSAVNPDVLQMCLMRKKTFFNTPDSPTTFKSCAYQSTFDNLLQLLQNSYTVIYWHCQYLRHLQNMTANKNLLCLPCFGLFSSFHAIFDARRSQPMIRPCTVAYVITCCKPAQMSVKILISNSLQ